MRRPAPGAPRASAPSPALTGRRCVCATAPPPARSLHGDHRNAANAAATMDRGEQLFRAREARERAAEAALLAEYDREVAEKEARDRAAAQAEALAKELERRQREHDAKQRMQQKVRGRIAPCRGPLRQRARSRAKSPHPRRCWTRARSCGS